MADTFNLGAVTAYASAVEGGYTGTYNDFKTLMANFANISTNINTAMAGKADLVNGKVPSNQLPSYVDDVIEGYYKTANSKFYEENTYETEITGETGKIYLDLTTNDTYRWSGSAYVKINDVDISSKADKVSSATNGNFAGLDSNGNLVDSGKKASDFVLTTDSAKMDINPTAATVTSYPIGTMWIVTE